ncbi:MAG: hypothetical protein A3E87_05380 [Gammaproteobacteria bacterium RIFCSPHIGHO2_12_FULL_35_23]|nr:MAG: hypothetical protein A3E87_05380 [Gammaproteobacteria bacterium RIFCSPHIGHO2_12_FULL_35_23]
MKFATFLKVSSAMALLTPGLLFASLLGSNDKAKDLVTNLAQGKIKIVKQFDSVSNLEGFVITPTSGPAQQTIVYADKDGNYMIAGAIITPDGQNLAQLDYDKYVNSALSPQIFASAQKTNWIQDGNANAPHKAYILVEPNCMACHMLYNTLKPLISSGQLAVRWIFVAFMKPQSEAMVAAIMQTNNPSLAFATDEKNFNVNTETGGIPPATSVSAATKKKIDQNMTFMTQYQFIGTPVVAYKSTAGDYQVIRGFLPGQALLDTVSQMSNSF